MPKKKIKIDWEMVDRLLKSQCEGTAIADTIGIAPDTLYRRCKDTHKIGFAEYSAQKKAVGKEALRAKQFQIAMKGDRTMLIWLGKQYLGQCENRDSNTNINIHSPLQVVVAEKQDEINLGNVVDKYK